jgi:hypothetical protein
MQVTVSTYHAAAMRKRYGDEYSGSMYAGSEKIIVSLTESILLIPLLITT